MPPGPAAQDWTQWSWPNRSGASSPQSTGCGSLRKNQKGKNQKGSVTLENNSQVSPTPFYFFLLSYSVLSETGRFTDYESGQIMCYLHNVMKRLDTIPYMEYMIK